MIQIKSSSVHIDNKKKDILNLGKGPVDSLYDTTLTTEKEYSIDFTEQQKKFCLSLHYNGINSYIFFNGVEIYKAKDFEINAAPLCFDNLSKDFSDFSFDYFSTDVDDILDIHKYLI